MIVVDVNVLIYLLLQGEHAAACEELYQQDPEWAAPILWEPEFLNVMATYERNGMLSRDQAMIAYNDAQLLLGTRIYPVEAADVLETAKQTGCSGYDAHYLALANRLGYVLYTFDKRLLQVAGNSARRPKQKE
ncbi:MAG: type II toxin-antitoxin system VapC family toxin [Verrucomicrobiota bacterium JB022]|nr:type II toxin-antitoxin system VapC family toxin [Verrucomicrobiota bacterium JB022]